MRDDHGATRQASLHKAVSQHDENRGHEGFSFLPKSSRVHDERPEVRQREAQGQIVN
jgi:hypothetical protein